MNSIKQWIEENKFGNVFDAQLEVHERLCYKDKRLLFKMVSFNSFMCSSTTDRILGRCDDTRYESIDEALLSLDKRGLFKTDLKWKMIISIIKERMI